MSPKSQWIILLALSVLDITAAQCGNDAPSYCGSGQCAPDNHDDYCRTNSRFASEHVLPDDWVLMFDSRDYQNLIGLSSPALAGNDVDGDGGQWTQRGGICQYDLRACSFSLGAQNNWFFTRHIYYPAGSVAGFQTEIYLNVTFRFSQCTGNPACSNDYATLYRYDTNSIASSTDRTNTNNYSPLFGSGTETTDSRLQQAGSTDITSVRSFVTPGDKGFHLGVRDSGTCGQIGRIYLYYTPCMCQTDGLVTYPELVRPPAGSQDPHIIDAVCAPNSDFVGGSTFSAYSDGTCERNVMCKCNPGYELDASETGCTACPAGTYRSSTDPHEDCLNCPMNTVMSAINASICACTEGYFRDTLTNERPDVSCTTGPTAPTSLDCNPMGNSITVNWAPPSDLGGRVDTYYIVEYQKVSSTGNYTLSLPVEGGLTYTINDLDSVTRYRIRVIAENGVSDQDMRLGIRDTRIANTVCETLEGVPEPPSSIRVIDNIVFLWQPPSVPNGVIRGYEISISYNAASTNGFINVPSVHLNSSMFVYVLRKGIVPENVTAMIRVRANTSAGYGEFSSPITFVPFASAVVTITECKLEDMALPLAITAVVAFAIGFVLMFLICVLHIACRKFCCKEDKYDVSKNGYPNSTGLSETKVSWD